MAVKYVKDFFFGPMTSVQRYAKGGHVTKVPAKAAASAKGMPAKAKPNAPATGAKRMESPPKVGRGQGYAKGGKVPGKQMDRQPTKTPPGKQKDVAPSKPFKGAYEGYAKGGKARRYEDGGLAQIDPSDGTAYAGETKADPRFGTIYKWPNGDWRAEPYTPPPGPDSSLWAPISRPDYDDTPVVTSDRGPMMPDSDFVEMLKNDAYPMQPVGPYVDPGPGPSIAYEDPDFYQNHFRRLREEMARPSRGYLNADEGMSGIGRAMRERGMNQPMMARPVAPGARTAMYAKGGHVKGQAKVGKVMSEYKAGELHSGSKKGPLVKNPKQAVAIALSEARKSGAKIPKKADGGVMASKPAVSKPKSVSVTKVTKTVSNGKDAALNERKMLDFLRSLSKDEVADMMEKRAMQAPAMDPDMPTYRKGGVARKGVPAHKSKAMYGGGKC